VRETYNVLEDHVWVEVRTLGRWTHVDPCEDAIDKPLMYKHGWKKNCHLVLSFSVAEGVRFVSYSSYFVINFFKATRLGDTTIFIQNCAKLVSKS